uniref:Uncharacterized protein n=1 Tax=Glossina pallidipes TaxID=7398 RepID=A0A1A9Z0K2_GLOPL
MLNGLMIKLWGTWQAVAFKFNLNKQNESNIIMHYEFVRMMSKPSVGTPVHTLPGIRISNFPRASRVLYFKYDSDKGSESEHVNVFQSPKNIIKNFLNGNGHISFTLGQGVGENVDNDVHSSFMLLAKIY